MHNSGKYLKARIGGFSFDCSRFLASLRAIAKILPNSVVLAFIAITSALSVWTSPPKDVIVPKSPVCLFVYF